MNLDYIKSGVSACHYTGSVRQNLCDLSYLMCNEQSAEKLATLRSELTLEINKLSEILTKIDKVNKLK